MGETEDYFAVEGSGTTVVHPVGLFFLLVCGGLLLCLPRKYAVWPLALLVCFVASRQCVAVFGLNLYFLRIMVLVFGGIRVVTRNEFQKVRLNALDWCFLLYGVSYWLTGVLNFGILSAEVKMRSGSMVDIIGLYLLLRCLLRTEEDVNTAIKGLAILALPLVSFFMLEYSTGKNLFSVFGGVAEYTAIRDGRLRCQGAFGHPLLAGTIWASFVPLFIYRALDREEKFRLLFMASFLSALIIVVLTASSTSVLGAAAAVGGMMMFRFRHFTKPVLILIGLTIPVLHMVMKGPVWSLITKINITSGNSSYHRFILVDGFINHWREWILLGSRVGTAHWGHFTFDTANQYVAAGVTGGIITLGLFLAIIVQAFLAASRVARHKPLLGWTLAVVVGVHSLSFFGISIWGQLHFAWALPIAMISGLQQLFARERRLEQPEMAQRFDQEASLAR